MNKTLLTNRVWRLICLTIIKGVKIVEIIVILQTIIEELEEMERAD